MTWCVGGSAGSGGRGRSARLRSSVWWRRAGRVQGRMVACPREVAEEMKGVPRWRGAGGDAHGGVGVAGRAERSRWGRQVQFFRGAVEMSRQLWCQVCVVGSSLI